MPRRGLDSATILRAAIELADEQGVEGVTLAILAQKLQVRSPSLYNHVNGLPELRRQLSLTGLTQMFEHLRNAVKDQTGDEALQAFCYAYLSFARAHPGLYEAIQRSPESNDAEHQEASLALVELAISTLTEWEIKGEHAVHAVRGIRSLLHGFVSLEKQGGFGMPVGLDDTFQIITNTYFKGLKAVTKRET